MLYDPKWEVEADPFTLESLISWAERQPAEKTYSYHCNRCYLGQYFEDAGFKIEKIGSAFVTFEGHSQIPLPPHFNMIAQFSPRTFGAALARARAVLASR